MKHLFLPYNLSLLAKEKGFNAKCLTYYGFDTKIKDIKGGWLVNSTMLNNQCTAPIYQQVIDWIRIDHDIHIIIERFEDNTFDYVLINDSFDVEDLNYDTNDTYYEALNKAIEEALKLIKWKKI